MCSDWHSDIAANILDLSDAIDARTQRASARHSRPPVMPISGVCNRVRPVMRRRSTTSGLDLRRDCVIGGIQFLRHATRAPGRVAEQLPRRTRAQQARPGYRPTGHTYCLRTWHQPAAMADNGTTLAIGSPGADRITTAILQALVGYMQIGLPLDEAIRLPRAHVEFPPEGVVSVACEPGLPIDDVTHPAPTVSTTLSMYFRRRIRPLRVVTRMQDSGSQPIRAAPAAPGNTLSSNRTTCCTRRLHRTDRYGLCLPCSTSVAAAA